MSQPNPTDKDELREKLAAIEHERWADWMEYMLDCAIKSGDDNIGVRTCGWPTAQFEHWQRQIETGYEELSDKEKSSDMEQVDRYWSLIEDYADQRVKEARIDQIHKDYQAYLVEDCDDERTMIEVRDELLATLKESK